MKIIQPRNVKNKDGSVRLNWNPSFSAYRGARFTKAQRYIDSEVIRLMIPYVPMKSGALYKSIGLGSKIGSGIIHQNAPYARYLYYGKLMVSIKTGSAWAKYGEKKVLTDIDLVYSKERHPKAGKMWFEVMKAHHKNDILRGLKTYL
jgi:hypothetical protein